MTDFRFRVILKHFAQSDVHLQGFGKDSKLVGTDRNVCLIKLDWGSDRRDATSQKEFQEGWFLICTFKADTTKKSGLFEK
jgi:hypothetical protein